MTLKAFNQDEEYKNVLKKVAHLKAEINEENESESEPDQIVEEEDASQFTEEELKLMESGEFVVGG